MSAMNDLVALLVVTVLLGGAAMYVAAVRDTHGAWAIGIGAILLAGVLGLLVYAAGTPH